MSSLQICLFGGLALSWDDRLLPPISSPLARSLLAYLVTYRDRPHTRDLLAGTFWPDLPDSVARRRLSQALWQIRTALRETLNLEAAPILVTEGDTVQWNSDRPLRLDLATFEQAATREGAFPQVAGDLERAVELYRGEFMAGYYDDWILLERERLREVLLGTLRRLIAGFKSQGAYPRALAYARRLVSEDALSEQGHREVMRLCHLLGRPNEALQQYQLCRRLLADELDIPPAANTVALAQEIARAGGLSEIPHLPVASRSSPLPLLEHPDRLPLVGRRAERAELAQALESAVAGRGGLLLLAGPAGVGKTRLMKEVARDAAWRGVRALWSHSCELSAPVPYQSLVEVLHQVDLSSLSPAWRRELARLIPELGPPPPRLDPEQERGRLLEALARALLSLGRKGPHLIVLEDIHWMDTASVEALQVLLPRLPNSRLLVVATFRPEELADRPHSERCLAALEATRLPQRLELAPFSEEETQALVQRILDLARPAPRFSHRLYTATAGNPFFLGEMLQTLVEEGLLYRDEEGLWHTPWDRATQDYAELPVPQSVAQSIGRRLARLEPAVRDLLDSAAVIGHQVAFDLWLATSQRGEQALLTAAEVLVRRGLLADAEDYVGYRFAHDLIRQVVYASLSPVRRRLRHRRVAEALEPLDPHAVEALARHFRHGHVWPQAVHYALRAGEHAQAVYANQQALDYFCQAERWLVEGQVDWPAKEVTRWRARLAEVQGQVQALIGRYDAAETAFSRSRQMWSDMDDRRGVTRVLNRLSFLSFVRGNYPGARRHAQEALGLWPEGDAPADLQATCLTHLGLSAWAQGQYDAARPPLEQARALFVQTGGDPYGLARCLNSLGLVHLEQGDLDLADRRFAHSLELRRQIGDRRGEAWCQHNQGRTDLARGDREAARAKLETARAIFVEIEHPSGLQSCDRYLARLAQAEAGASPRRQIVVRLAHVDAPTGRPLRDDEFVEVSWTVVAPEDEAIGGKVERRRHCLRRLLQEAAGQEAAPTVPDLAAALGVSARTIKRDLAALRAAGYEPITRGGRSTGEN